MSSAPTYPALSEPLVGLLRLRAPNPSVMTGAGTNTYVLGREEILVIDPGPLIESHIEQLLDLVGDRLRYVLVTHCHLDHAPAAAPLAERTGATLLSFGSRPGLVPDGELSDGDVVQVDDHSIDVVHTPGHSSDHLCYLWRPTAERGPVLFSGDHVMGGSTVVIGPPDGDMSAYLRSIDRLLGLEPAIETIAPGHGDLMHEPAEVLRGYRLHRLEREAAVRSQLSSEPVTPAALVTEIYPELGEALRPAAARQLWAHLRKLGQDDVAIGEDPDRIDGWWRLSDEPPRPLAAD